jgi:hypothetical protein
MKSGVEYLAQHPGWRTRSPKKNKQTGTEAVTLREFDTIIAALRYWQAVAEIPIDFTEIALEHGKALSSSEIDNLIGKLNQ